MERRGQTDAIEVHSLDSEKPWLIDGLNRLETLKLLGKEWVEAREPTVVCESAGDRLYQSALNNEVRQSMTWLELGKVWKTLIKSGHTQTSIAKGFGVSKSFVSRQIAATKIDDDKLEVLIKNDVPVSVVHEMSSKSVPDEAVVELVGIVESGRGITVADVRNVVNEKKSKTKTKPKPKPKKKKTTAAGRYTYQDIGNSDLGDDVRVRVYGDRIDIKLTLGWEKPTFKEYDLVAEIKDKMDEIFADLDLPIGSMKAFARALTSAKKQIKS